MKKFLLVLLNSLGVIILNAQALSYSFREELLNKQLNDISLINNSIFNSENDIIRGKEFYPPSNNIIHPFFIDNSWRSGKIWLSGRVFEIENIKYDINRDYLVHMHSPGSTAYPIYLTREYINEFIINDHHFRFLDDFDEESKDKFRHGYYEILYDKKTKFYLRWEKSKDIRSSISGSNFEEQIYFLLRKDEKYISVKGQKDLVNALEDHKKEIKSFMKANSLRFSKKNYESVIAILNYYDNL